LPGVESDRPAYSFALGSRAAFAATLINLSNYHPQHRLAALPAPGICGRVYLSSFDIPSTRLSINPNRS